MHTDISKRFWVVGVCPLDRYNQCLSQLQWVEPRCRLSINSPTRYSSKLLIFSRHNSWCSLYRIISVSTSVCPVLFADALKTSVRRTVDWSLPVSFNLANRRYWAIDFYFHFASSRCSAPPLSLATARLLINKGPITCPIHFHLWYRNRRQTMLSQPANVTLLVKFTATSGFSLSFSLSLPPLLFLSLNQSTNHRRLKTVVHFIPFHSRSPVCVFQFVSFSRFYSIVTRRRQTLLPVCVIV